MAKHKHVPYVVLGAHDKPNKGMIAYKCKGSNAYWLSFIQLKNDGKYDFGDSYNVEDIDGIYQSILFCDVRSVEAMIKELTMIRDKMMKDKLKVQDKDAVQSLYGFKRGYKNEHNARLETEQKYDGD
jgi:hypothetical protein